MVHLHALLVHPQLAIVHLSDADAAHVFIVVDGADQNLSGGVGISLGSRDIVQNRLKQRAHIHLRILQVLLGKARSGGGKQEGAVQLLIGSIQIHKQLQGLVDHFLGSGLGTVNLI